MIDITRALHNGHPNWPGDTPFALHLSAAISSGSSVNLMRLSSSTHCGTHLDAPFHYRDDGGRLGTVPLDLLMGEALLLSAAGRDEVGPDILPDGPLPQRVLFATGQPDSWTVFPEDFPALAPELIVRLAERGVRLVGTDTPSVDRFDSRSLPSHAACGERGVAIVEGLRLAGVAAGRYRLLCLPLHLPDADAAPVRAVLEPL